MKSFFKLLASIYNGMLRALVALGGALLAFMMLSIAASVLFRRASINFAWALEISEYILIVSTLCGAGWLIRTGGHVRVDIVSTYTHGRTRTLYEGIAMIVVALVCVIFSVIGVNAAREAYISGIFEEKVYMRFPKWILLSLFPAGGFFMIVESLRSAFLHFKKLYGEQAGAGRKVAGRKDSEQAAA